MPPLDVAIVGAGISGLSAAYDLQRRGLTVRVLDASDRAGGVIGTTRRDGYGARFVSGPEAGRDGPLP